MTRTPPDPQEALRAVVEDAKQKKREKARASAAQRRRAQVWNRWFGVGMMRTSLAQLHWAWPVVTVLGWILALSFPLFLIVTDLTENTVMPAFVRDTWPWLREVINILLCIAWILFFQNVLERPVKHLFALRALQWLDTLPYGFDKAAYLECLYDERDSASVDLHIRFATPVASDVAKLMAKAAHAKDPTLSKVEWTDDKTSLLLRSATVKTSWMSVGRTGATWRYSNKNVHSAFRALVEDVVPLLAAAHPVERLDVEILGKLATR